MPYEVLDSAADSGAMSTAISDFAGTVTSVDSVEDTLQIGPNRVLITVQYTA